MRSGTRLRVGFIAYLYRKILTLSVSHTSSPGLIINLINDTQRFEDAGPFGYFIIVAPIETLAIVGLLVSVIVSNPSWRVP